MNKTKKPIGCHKSAEKYKNPKKPELCQLNPDGLDQSKALISEYQTHHPLSKRGVA